MSNNLRVEWWHLMEWPRSTGFLRCVSTFGKFANQTHSRFGKRRYHGFGEYLPVAE